MADPLTALRALATEAKDRAERIPEGCGDNSCNIRKPKGMATNGGCRCDEVLLRRAVRSYRRRAEAAPALASAVLALLTVVEALPRCACGALAIVGGDRGTTWCDGCAPFADGEGPGRTEMVEAPYAQALRALGGRVSG